MLRVTDLTVRYETVEAVTGADLELADGETLALLGRSGSGKTTILRAIAGLVRPQRGSITLDGEALQGVPTHQRRIGLVFQDFALFPHLDVGDNVAYGLRMSGVADSERRVREALAMVGLDGMQGRRIDQLSGGQAQRVALARTLAPRPRLLLLDEPMGSLDPDLRSTVAAEVKSLLDGAGIATIVVTHDTAEAFAFGDRIAVLVDGRMAQTGAPEGVWGRPVSADVARLVGHRSIVSTTAQGGSVVLGDVRVPVQVEDGPVDLLALPDAVSSPGPIATRVVDARYRGPDWVAVVTLGASTVEVRSDRERRRGEAMTIAVDPTHIIVL